MTSTTATITTLNLLNDASFNGNVIIGKDITINGRLNVQQYQNQNIINTTTTNYQLIISEDLSLNGRLFVSGNVAFNGTVTGITKTMVGLSNVDNTSDTNKPISTLTQSALDLKSSISYVDSSLNTLRTYTDNSLNLKAAISYVDSSLNALITYTDSSLNSKAAITYVDSSLNSKAAITYVDSSLNSKATISYVDSSLNLKATLYSPTFTGTVTIPTANITTLNAFGDSSFTGNVTIGGRLYIGVNTIYANAIVGGSVSTGSISSTGDLSLNNRLFVGSDTSLNGNLFVNNNVTINGYTYSIYNVTPNNIAASNTSNNTWSANGISWSASASDTYSGQKPSWAFDTTNQTFDTNINKYNSTTGAYSVSGVTNLVTNITGITSISGEWIQLQSNYSVKLSSYSIKTPSNTAYAANIPQNYYILGSNDGNIWNAIIYVTTSSLPSSSSGSILPSISTTSAVSNSAYGNSNITTTLYSGSSNSYTYFRMVVTSIFPNNVSGLIEINEWTPTFSLQKTSALTVNGDVSFNGNVQFAANSISTDSIAQGINNNFGMFQYQYTGKTLYDLDSNRFLITRYVVDSETRNVIYSNTDLTINGNITSLYDMSVNRNLSIGGNISINGRSTATSFTTPSDYRIKANIQSLIDTSFTVDLLKPVTYINKKLNTQDVGFIAHEVQEQYPFLVIGEKDGQEHQSLNYIGLIGILTKEIQELKKEMKEMKNELALLKQ